jgi:hypothetical protein
MDVYTFTVIAITQYGIAGERRLKYHRVSTAEKKVIYATNKKVSCHKFLD